MLNRKIDRVLTDWSQSQSKKALLIRGARQVGKTTTVRDFGKKNYKNFVEINFEKHQIAKQAFDGNLDADTIITKLSIMGFGRFEEGKTLVFFDEIQACPKARTAIKFLVEDGRFDYIESGSLLGLNYADVLSYPTGFEKKVDMFPLDFEEFLWARQVPANLIIQIKERINNIEPIDDFIHEQLSKYYREYLVVGGMPEVVNTYISNVDYSNTLSIQTNIINSYLDDIAKYAGHEKVRAKLFFDAIPSELSKERKRFVLSNIENKTTASKYADAAQWLVDAGIAYLTYNTHNLLLPFEQYEKRNMYKVYLLDTGLLCSMWKEKIQWEVISGNININEGALTENFVAAEIAKKGLTLHYYDKKSRQELDFIIARNNKIDIIEVKSGNDYMSHYSLNTALQQSAENIGRAIVLSKFPIKQTDRIIYMPLYAFGLI